MESTMVKAILKIAHGFIIGGKVIGGDDLASGSRVTGFYPRAQSNKRIAADSVGSGGY